jgi:hypothetical protein
MEVTMSGNKLRRIVLASSVSVGFVGCGTNEPGNQHTFTETSVTIASDGTATSTVKRVTAEQIELENVERQRAIDLRAQGIEPTETRDSSCAGADVWIFDGLNQSGNKICFTGSGTQLLINYCDFEDGIDCTAWSYAAASVWGGSLTGSIAPNSTCSVSTPFQQVNVNCLNENWSVTQN